MTQLCSVQDYWDLTGDFVTLAPTVTARIDVAIGMIEEACNRSFTLQTVTEDLAFWPDQDYPIGWVYPTVTPVVSTVTGVLHPSSSSRIRLQVIPTTNDGIVWTQTGLWISTTYTGGYTNATCPPNLKHAIARLSKALGGSPQVAGSGPVRMGDISVNQSERFAALDQWAPGLSQQIRGYVKRVTKQPVYGPMSFGISV